MAADAELDTLKGEVRALRMAIAAVIAANPDHAKVLDLLRHQSTVGGDLLLATDLSERQLQVANALMAQFLRVARVAAGEITGEE